MATPNSCDIYMFPKPYGHQNIEPLKAEVTC